MPNQDKIPIFIDTNVLLHHFDYKIDIEAAINRVLTRKYDIFVHRLVEAEIIATLTKKGKVAKNAKIAVQLMSRYKEYDDQIEHAGTDIALIETAQKEKGVVLTFDRTLKFRCKARGIPVISNYKTGRFELIGEIE